MGIELIEQVILETEKRDQTHSAEERLSRNKLLGKRFEAVLGTFRKLPHKVLTGLTGESYW